MTTNSTLPNRVYQDSLFRKLFSTKDKIIELYNALENSHYGPDTPVEITTLEDVAYIDRKNDLGFLIDDRFVVLAEHQASINPNMPVRQAVYMGRTLEHLILTSAIYSQTRQDIPVPEFFVLYTGKAEWNAKILRLSDSFKAVPPENSMELVVKIINLQYNKDNEILKRSRTLEGYSRLIFYTRDNLKACLSLHDSINLAIKRCITENFNAEFLRKYSQEVGNMLFEEITWEQFAEIRAKDAAKESFNNGLETGRQLGIEQGVTEVIKNMLENGISEAEIIRLTKCDKNMVEQARNILERAD